MSADNQRLAIEQLQSGMEHHRAGRLGPAQSHYERAAQLDPTNANARHLLGMCALQAGVPAVAAAHLRACIALAPGFAEAHNHLGVTLRRMGQNEEAIAAFRGAIAVRAHYVEAAYNLALACEAAGRDGDAETAYRQALAWRSDDFNSANNLGNLLRKQGRLNDALPWLDLARRLQPQSAQANGNFAMLLSDLGRYGEAVQFAQLAVQLEPAGAHWWRALGVAERLRGNTSPAVAALRRAVALAPADDLALSELCVALIEDGAVEEARTLFARLPKERQSERMRWSLALSLPSVYRDEAQVDAERKRYMQAIDEIDARLALATPKQQLDAYEAVCGVANFLLHYQPRDNTALQFRFGDLVHRVLAARVPQFMTPCTWRARAHGGRVRVGIVSSHLMDHTVSRYFRRLLIGLDRERFDLHVFYSGAVRDFSTRLFEERASVFEQLNEDAIATAQRIRAAQLDVLIYPEIGMDPRHHVLGALRLAPVQCLLYGHPVTSGLPNMDYYLSGAAIEPQAADTHYREKLVRLPGLGTALDWRNPPAEDAWVRNLTHGGPYVLCLQNHLKLAPAFDQVLANIAQRSGVKIGFFMRNEGVATRFRTRIEQAFRACGLEPERNLIFFPARSHAEFLGAVKGAALVLDSPWFSGGATSLDAFSVGTPVLTLRGEMARGRQTAAMLQMMDIDALIVENDSDYIERTISLLRDPVQLSVLREQIIQRSVRLFEAAPAIAAFENFLDAASGVVAAHAVEG
jgi:predicted O-linked N-acetylglucosamine transferase (SPINDLY family)